MRGSRGTLVAAAAAVAVSLGVSAAEDHPGRDAEPPDGAGAAVRRL